MIRAYVYTWWAMLLDKEAIILLADYKDIFFQTNPFKYIPEVSRVYTFISISRISRVIST